MIVAVIHIHGNRRSAGCRYDNVVILLVDVVRRFAVIV